MKLHIPLVLRALLLAVVGIYPVDSASSAEYYAEEGTYYAFDDRTGYDHITSYTLSKAVKLDDSGKYVYVPYKLDGNFNYFYRSRSYHNHECGESTLSYTRLCINENGGGADMTWQCSEFDAQGNLLTPGVWIMSQQSYDTEAVFTNYGDMVISDCRQQWYRQTPRSISSGVVTYGERQLINLKDGAPFYELDNDGSALMSISSLGFNVRVTDSDSFTYKNAYTSNTGAFVSGSRNVVFDGVKDITFSGNQAGYSGAIAYAGDSTWRNISDDTGFVVRNASGTVTFDNNSCSGDVSTGNGLFRNYLVRFSNVNEVVFSNNQCRLFSNYNYSIYTGFENCNRIVFSGNGVEGLDYIISSGTGDGILGTGSMRFDNCGDIVFSGNILGKGLFSSFPVFKDIDSLAFSGNTSSGTLLTNRSDAITIGAVRDILP